MAMLFLCWLVSLIGTFMVAGCGMWLQKVKDTAEETRAVKAFVWTVALFNLPMLLVIFLRGGA